MFDGETAFTLYDTYGFPLDLTQDALRARGISVDLAAFTDAMERQRAKARASWAGSGEAAQETVWFALREKLGATEFLGYETESAEGVVAALVKDGKEVAELKKGESGAVVVNQTPFYGESGGQVGDEGEMRREGLSLAVTDTQKKAGDLFAHFVTVRKGTVKVGDPLLLEVDHARRSAIRQNHSATHLLHEALRQVLGDHVAQKGSLVAPDRLRFDFSHPKPMTLAEIERVEDIANDIVLQNSPVTTRLMALDDARASGARALFGEKYGDEVRVVAMGEGSGNTLGWSVELCGGTHVKRTGDIGLISGLSDSGVAAGVRRLEALTGRAARKAAEKQIEVAKAAAAELKAPLEDMPARVVALLDERKKLERELSEARKKLAMGGGGKAAGEAADVRQVNGVKLDRARGHRHRAQGPAQPGRRGQEASWFRRGRHRRPERGRQGRSRGRRDRRSHQALQRGRAGEKGRRSARRQGRRRPPRHGAGRRSRRRQGRGGAQGDRGGARRRLNSARRAGYSDGVCLWRNCISPHGCAIRYRISPCARMERRSVTRLPPRSRKCRMCADTCSTTRGGCASMSAFSPMAGGSGATLL